MILAIGNVDLSPLFDSLIAMAQDKTLLHELNSTKGQGSWRHENGWGIAYLDKQGEWIIRKSTKAIFADPLVEELRNIKTNYALLHIRYASVGSVTLENTHPFYLDDQTVGEFIFCHNGTIREDIAYNPRFVPQGITDSERFFYAIITALETERNVTAAIANSFTKLKTCRDSNIILASKTTSYIAPYHQKYPRYFSMSFGKTKDMIIFSSEPLRALSKVNWQPLETGTILVIDNKTGRIETQQKASTARRESPLLVKSS